MMLDAKLDEGHILAQSAFDIPKDCTTPELTEALVDLSNKTLQSIIPLWFDDDIEAIPQELATMAASSTPTYSQKLSKQDGLIDWQKPANVIEREIRAYIEWPKSRSTLGDIDVIITKAHDVPSEPVDAKPGDIEIIEEPNVLMVATGNGSLCIERLKPAGKNEMDIKAFLAGYKNRLTKYF
jgi:methionyl-tRNA formyltransferase